MPNLVTISNIFKIQAAGNALWTLVFHFPATLRAAMFDGVYLLNSETQTTEIWEFCCPSDVQQNALKVSPASPFTWEGNRLKYKKIEISKIKPSLTGSEGKFFRDFGPGCEYMF